MTTGIDGWAIRALAAQGVDMNTAEEVTYMEAPNSLVFPNHRTTGYICTWENGTMIRVLRNPAREVRIDLCPAGKHVWQLDVELSKHAKAVR